MLIHQLVTDGAARRPDNVAFNWVDRNRSLTYAELASAIEAAAGALHHLGVRKGDRVTIFAHNGMDYLVAMFGCFRIGAIAALVNVKFAAELAYYLRNHKPGVIIYTHDMRDVVVAASQGVAHAFALQRYLVTVIAGTVLALVQAHLLNAAGSPVFDVAERLLDTAIGVAIAWIFSYVLPSWERRQVGALVERTLAAQSRHAGLTLALARPGGPDAESELAWRLARREAYDSLSALVQAIQRALSEPRAVRPRLQELERMVGHSYQLLAQLTAIKTLLLHRRERLDLAQLREPLAHAAAAMAAALQRTAPPAPVPHGHEEALPMLELPDESERDLSPFVLRRLRLAVEIARDLQGDAAAALAEPEAQGGVEPEAGAGRA